MGRKETDRIKEAILGFGAHLVGVADVQALKDLRLDPPNLLEPFSRAISVAIQIPAAVFEGIEERPTPIYNTVYQTANRLLDEIALRTAVALQGESFPSLPIPASQVLDRENWYAAISHKAVARMAGLGWQGKNLLLITPRYGSRVRLVTILTTAPLQTDNPIRNRCGSCTLCRDACPAGAIKGVPTQDHYSDRNEALHFSRCVEKVAVEFAKLPEIGVPICGICIKVCPFGRRGKGKEGSAAWPRVGGR
ncbi:MAG: epoxyqueuosine reductase [Deltaproteobacteria bacterium]|nr:epoxyqueuosine reductase [Deltaproteobacteria bacterium]